MSTKAHVLGLAYASSVTSKISKLTIHTKHATLNIYNKAFCMLARDTHIALPDRRHSTVHTFIPFFLICDYSHMHANSPISPSFYESPRVVSNES